MSPGRAGVPGGAGAAAQPAAARRRRFYLHPSRLFVSAEPHAVTTILGSCVAVCLWDNRRRVGGLNHYLLPFHAGRSETSGRFGNVSIQLLLDRLRSLGVRNGDLEAKVFGGACVMEMFRAGGSEHLGTKNAQMAFDMLSREGIPVVEKDTGGFRGRRLVFHTDDGRSSVQVL